MIAVLLAVPLAGALLLLAPPERYGVRRPDRYVRAAGVLFSGAALLVAVLVAATFDYGHPRQMTQVIDVPWATAIGLRFHVGVDGVSLPLVVLTALLTFLCLLHVAAPAPLSGAGRADAGRDAGRVDAGRTDGGRVNDGRALTGLLLLLEAGMLGTFVALDLLLFFLFLEAVLVPMYFLIAVWGGPGRRAAAYTFVIYTLLGSGLLLVGLMIIAAKGGTLDMVVLARRHGSGMSHGTQVAAFLLVGLGFAIKAPMWPLHSWLPDAHTEAPVVGSVLLAGVLLKMGTYGLVRIALPMAPVGARTWAPWLGALAVAGISYGSLACLAQRHLKRMIAFSSVGSMGFVLLGVASLTPAGANAALFGNVAHGLIIGLLFFLAGSIEERYGTGDLDAMGGLPARAPRLTAILTFACVAGLGLPGLAAFWGEMLALLGAYRPGPGLPRTAFVTYMAIGGLGAVLTMAYFLRLLYRIAHGPIVRSTSTSTSIPAPAGIVGQPAAPLAPPSSDLGPAEPVEPVEDVRPYEYVVALPLVALTLVIGMWPKALLDLTDGPVRALLGGG